MSEEKIKPAPATYDYASWIIMGIAMLTVLKLHLIVALITGFIIYELSSSITKLLIVGRLNHQRARIYSIMVITTVIAVTFFFLIITIQAFFPGDTESLSALFTKMAEVLDSSQEMLPVWMAEKIPQNAEELKKSAVEWLKTNAGSLPVAGKEAARIFAHMLIGIVLGSILSIMQSEPKKIYRPLTRALVDRVTWFHLSFRQIVFAQARIAALNTFFTWIYLGVFLPVMGIEMPFLKTLIAITFLAGLLPVVGNLISNTVIVVVSLSLSVSTAISSLIFLIIIHKLEYFLNARIIGSRIHSNAWELLIAMLIMESAFGLRGLIVAPIYYAYLKNELNDQGLV